jgi:hypothetical protein
MEGYLYFMKKRITIKMAYVLEPYAGEGRVA